MTDTKRRKYSVEEIDQMRRCVDDLMRPYGGHPFFYTLPPNFGQKVEERLRTYMLNGTSPEELEVAAENKRQERREMHERMKKAREERNAIRENSQHDSGTIQSFSFGGFVSDDQGSGPGRRGDVRRERIARFFRSLFG